jgi:WD40 repeat protein
VPLFDGDYAVFLRNTIRTFDPDDETWLRTTYIPTDRILAVSPAGNLAAGYEPFQVTLFDALNGTSVQTLPEEAEDVWVDYYWEGTIIRQFYGALFSPEGNRLATFGTGGIWFYAVPDISLLSHTDKGNNTRKAVFSPDGKWLLASTFENTFGPGLIDVETSATQMYIGQLSEQGEYGVGLSYSSYAFSPDKRLVAMARVSNREDDSVELVDVTTGEMISRISFENGRPYCLAFSPIGNLLAVGLYDGRIEIIDMATHRVVSEFQAHLGLINSLLFTQDGSRLITGGEDGIVKVWGVVEK